jgi:hypothetical protein
MAVVYVARQPDLDRLVALKEVTLIADEAFGERLVRELRVLEPLSHPNIVYVYEYLEHGGSAYVAMEYLERGSLRRFMGRVSLPQVAGILEGVLAALAHAESHGVVHGDLKPENVLVMREGAVKIADFGVPGALYRATGRFLTASGTTLSTAAYVAPEQVKGETIGPWTDLYAVGVIAHELLIGSIPFGDERNPLLLLRRRADEEIPPPGSLKPDLDPRLADWLQQLLIADPGRRTQRAADAAEQLEEVIVSLLGPFWRREAQLVETAPALEAPARSAATVISGSPTLKAPGTGDGAAGAGVAAAPTVIVPRGDHVPADPAGKTAERTAVAEGRRRRISRRVLLFALGGVLVAAVAGVLIATQVGGSGSKSAGAAGLAPSERLGLAVAGSSVLATNPNGRILALDPRTLATTGSLRDPARPRSVTVSGNTTVVADDETVTAFRTQSLAPVGAVGLSRAFVAATPGSQLLAAAATDRGGRLCVVSSLGLRPCADLGFAPTGLGLASAEQAFVADGAAGTVVPYQVGAGRLTAGTPIVVGPDPHGTLLAYRGRLYVALDSGVRVVELSTLQPSESIKLAARPESIWIAPSTGRLFAATPATSAVAMVDVTSPNAPPAIITTGSRPAAVTGALDSQSLGDMVYVADAADGTITRLDPLSGAVLGTASVAGLAGGAPVPPAKAAAAAVQESAAQAVATIRFGSGRLDPTSVVVRDGNLDDGSALVELWQGGIDSSLVSKKAPGLTIAIRRQPGRLEVELTALPHTFGRVEAKTGSAGRTADLELARANAP